MHLMITENQKFLIRFRHYSDNSEIEIFSLNPIQKRFTCMGRIVGFSRDSSRMIVWDGHYQTYNLAQGIALLIEEVNRADFAPEVLLDVRQSKPGMRMQVFDVINGTVIRELTVPEEKGVSKGVEAAIKIIGTPYGMMNVWYDTTWGEGNEGHIFELTTGKYQIMTNVDIDHHQAKHNRLFLRHFFSASRIKFGEEIIIEDIVFSKNPMLFLRRWPVSAIASFPTNRSRMAFAQERTVYFVDILPPEENPEDKQQIREYQTSISSKINAWAYTNALCIDETGRYLYISYDKGNFRVFDIQAKEFSEEYRIPTKIPKATRRGSRAPK